MPPSGTAWPKTLSSAKKMIKVKRNSLLIINKSFEVKSRQCDFHVGRKREREILRGTELDRERQSKTELDKRETETERQS